MTAFSEYGIAVKKRLIELGMTQRDLEREVNKKTGLFVDCGYLYKILTGSRSAPRIVGAINEILSISDSNCSAVQ